MPLLSGLVRHNSQAAAATRGLHMWYCPRTKASDTAFFVVGRQYTRPKTENARDGMVTGETRRRQANSLQPRLPPRTDSNYRLATPPLHY